MPFRIISTLFLPLVAVGCASDPAADRTASHSPATPPTADSPPPSADVDAILAASELHPDALVAAVLARNPDLASLQHAWRASATRPAQVRALDDPNLAYGFSPATLGEDDLDFGQRIELSQKIPWPGKRRLRGEQAESEARAAFEHVADARRLLTREALANYAEWFFVHRALAITRENRKLLADVQRLAEDKFATGRTSKQDALQAEVEGHHLEHRVITLERQRLVARARLNTLLRRAPDLDLPPPPATLAYPVGKSSLRHWLDRAVESRPDLRALARRIEARRAGVELARLDFKPDFTVMGIYNSMWARDEHRAMIGAGINLPIGGDRRAALAERRAELAAEEARFAAAVDRVALEVTEAYEALAESRHVIRLYRDTFIPSAREHLDAARADYDAGKADILALLTAEKNLRLARLGLQQALTDYHTRRAELRAAAGQGS